MKFLILILIAANTAFATGNFEALTEQYEASSQPTQSELMKSRWMLVAMVANYSLELNKGHHDYLDETGVKNSDGSQMFWQFVSYEHPLYKFTLSKVNFLKAYHDHIAIGVKSLDESKSIAFAFSAFPNGKSADLYYIQHCRINNFNRLICPLILKVKDEVLPKYSKFPKIMEAKDKITIIQEFRAE